MEKGTKKETKRRVIVVGSEGHHGVESITWDAGSMPNLADYESVILSTSSLDELLVQARAIPEEQRRNYLTGISNNLYYVMGRLLHVFNSKGNVYAVCSKPVRTLYGSNQFGAVRNYDWLPLPVRLIEESGRTIELIDKSYQRYFEFVDKWSFCFEEVTENDEYVKRISELHEREYLVKLDSEVIAQNRYARPIAIKLGYYLRDKPKYGQDPNKYTIRHTSGSLILLPLPTKIDVKEAINILLEDFEDIKQRTQPPDWIEAISVPKESEIKKDILLRQSQINRLTEEIELFEKQKEEQTKFKQLLYETGTPLQDICRTTFELLGFAVDCSYEDFVITKNNEEAIVEVKGKEGVIERKDSSQLSQNRRNYAIQKSRSIKDVKAILLGNPWRLIPPEERVKKDAFASHVIEDAKVEDMILLTTLELFKALCALLENKLSRDEIVGRLFSAVGVIKLCEGE
jgi:hypothetical protein